MHSSMLFCFDFDASASLCARSIVLITVRQGLPLVLGGLLRRASGYDMLLIERPKLPGVS
jgi:hypothetical protein